VGAGAKILGPITLQDKVRVGANSVVIEDVVAGCTVVGIPGKVVQVREAGKMNPFGIDLDHHLIPDPVGKAIACLVERIALLENQLNTVMRNPEECDVCEAQSVCETETHDDQYLMQRAAGGK